MRSYLFNFLKDIFQSYPTRPFENGIKINNKGIKLEVNGRTKMSKR